MKQQVQMNEPKKIYFKNLLFDKNNPNQLSEEQEASVEKSLRKFGFIDTIIVDLPNKNGKQLIHHGEHRIKKLMKLGNTWAWGFEVKLNKIDHRLLRQAMNKLHGTHDADMDKQEYEFLAKKGKLAMLASLIAQPEEQLVVEKEMVPVTKDKEMIQHHADTFIHGGAKQLYFIFTNAQYEKIMPKIERIKSHMKVKDNTDLFVRLVDSYIKTNLKKRK